MCKGGAGGGEGSSDTPEIMMAKVAEALGTKESCLLTQVNHLDGETLAQEEESLFQHDSPGSYSLGA